VKNDTGVRNKIGLCILCLFIIWFITFLAGHIDEFKQLTLVHPKFLIAIFLLSTLQYYFIGLITKCLMTPLKFDLATVEAFGISTVSGFYNLIMPFKAGTAIRSIYLKKKYNFPYTDFISIFSASYILIFWIGGLLGLLSILWIYYSQHSLNLYILALFVITFVTLSIIVVQSPTIPQTRHRWLNKFIQIINNWSLIRSDRKVLLFTSFLSCAQLLNAALMLYLLFHVFNFDITFIQAVLLAVTGYLGALISITPASLGIKEAAVVLTATTVGITPVESLSAVVLGRAINICVLTLFGSYFSYHYGKHI